MILTIFCIFLYKDVLDLGFVSSELKDNKLNFILVLLCMTALLPKYLIL